MKFDALCKVVESNHLENQEGLLRHTKLFLFPLNSKQLPQSYTPDQVSLFEEQFFLPFRNVTIEDETGCTMLIDSTENQSGIDGLRYFVDFVLLDSKTDSGINDYGIWSLCFGRVKGFRISDVSLWTHIEIDRCLGGSLRTGEVANIDKHDEVMQQAAVRNVQTAYQEIMYFNTPDRFIVQSTPRRVRDPLTSAKIPRAQDRPNYILLYPKQIRERFGIQGDGVNAPHPVRRHFRTLRSDYYTNKQGQRVAVKGYWTGDTEKVVDGRHYKILLDR